MREGRREKGDGRREKGEGRREKGEGRRVKGDGRREKEEGRREKGEGRWEKGEGGKWPTVQPYFRSFFPSPHNEWPGDKTTIILYTAYNNYHCWCCKTGGHPQTKAFHTVLTCKL